MIVSIWGWIQIEVMNEHNCDYFIDKYGRCEVFSLTVNGFREG